MKRSSFVLFFVILAMFTIIVDRPALAQSSPVQIANCQDLQNIGTGNNSISGNFEPLNGNYALANDIDCSATKNWNNGFGFIPIDSYSGNGSAPVFNGVLNGSGHTINNLYINASNVGIGTSGPVSVGTTSPVGLISVASGAVIENVNVANATVKGGTYNIIAILAGYLQGGSTVQNVQVQGSVVAGSTAYTGGMIGSLESSQIIQSSANINITGGNLTVGGLVGYLSNGIIDLSYAVGNINSQSIIGGLAGTEDYQSSINNSYSNVQINFTCLPQGSYNSGGIGGLIGNSYDSSSPYLLITNSYAAGEITAQGSNCAPYELGGLVASALHTPTVTSSYWDKDVTGQSTSVGSSASAGLTTAQMYLQSSYVNWDFNYTWISDNQGYPVLIWQEQDPQIDLWNTFSAAAQESTFEPASPPNTVDWAGISAANANTVNWVDLFVLSRPIVWAYQSATAISGFVNSVNWNYLGGLSYAPINWTDVGVLSRMGINWSSVNPLVKSGINWSDWVVSTSSGINWNDLVLSSRTGINWGTICINNKAGTNWNDWSVMTRSGVNWFDVSVLSNQGINWNSIGNLTNPVNVRNLVGMTKKGINWELVNTLSKEFVNWDNPSTLSLVPMTATDLNTLRTIGVSTNGFSPSVQTAQLTLILNGTASGAFTSTPAGLYCESGSSSGCTASFPLNEPVTLNFFPINNSYVSNWGGCNSPTASNCSVTLDGSIFLNIAISPGFSISTTTNGTGTGSILCDGGACPSTVPAGSGMTFTAQPGSGAVFGGWEGTYCTAPGGSNENPCTILNINSNITVEANFIQTYALNLSTYGAGSATFLCNSSACPATVQAGSNEIITVKPSAGTIFESWGNYCTAAGGTANGASCTIDNINSTVNLTAILGLAPPMFTITTSTTGPGSGSLYCNGSPCPVSPFSVNTGTVITFTGHPNPGSVLEGLGGVCAAPGGPIFNCPFEITSNIIVSAYFIKSPPPAPTSLTAKAGASGIALSWSNEYGVSNNVYRAELGVNGNRYTQIKNVGYPNTSYTDTTMPKDGTYYYYVTGVYYPDIESPRSKVVAVIWKDQSIPSTPTGLTATTKIGQVDISWNTSLGADNFYVKKALVAVNGKVGTYTIIAVVNNNPTVNTASFKDYAVVNGRTYDYMVVAHNDKGTSAYSLPVIIKAK